MSVQIVGISLTVINKSWVTSTTLNKTPNKTNLDIYAKECSSQWSYENEILHPAGPYSNENEYSLKLQRDYVLNMFCVVLDENTLGKYFDGNQYKSN